METIIIESFSPFIEIAYNVSKYGEEATRNGPRTIRPIFAREGS
ncbi:hypothetical protein SAMN06295960_3477 [Paenibacillus aquistagni]|uniref:Uncharacterized protein n=1 Tax=Paenibacillus aquistagni TaxID=1852522 RepID=A0A1X7LHJ4_9BACL|nr:hypothetical protein SAMN06295960_3477 [Paenibacillus aquistagni]